MTALVPGEILPSFALPTDRGDTFELYADTVAGRFVALLFCPEGLAAATQILADFTAHHEQLGEARTLVAVISSESPSVLAEFRAHHAVPFELLSDPSGETAARCGIAGQDRAKPATLLVRPNEHIMATIDGDAQAAAVLERVRRELALENDAAAGMQAPVLTVPEVFTRHECRQLIDLFNREDVQVYSADELQGKTFDTDVKVIGGDYGRLDRVDYYIYAPDVRGVIAQRLRTRLLPEISKAFHYSVQGYEDLTIARYEAGPRGVSHGHRDNSNPGNAARRFALSINLNTEEFEGGGVRFPEFSSQCFRAPTGAAMVFSCSLLHEGVNLSKGTRYVLVTFLT